MLSQSLYVGLKDLSVSVTHLEPSKRYEQFSAVLSNKELKVYAFKSDQCAHLCNLIGHQGVITHQCFKSEQHPDTLLSASDDGVLLRWDLRDCTYTERFRHEHGLTCIAQNDQMTAVGTEGGTICFLDERRNKLLAEFTDTHASTVTWINFHQETGNKFFSASDDGMLSVFDLSLGLDEDVSFKAGQNLDPISQFGLYGENDAYLWCQTAQHGLVLWEWKDALVEESDHGAVPFLSKADIRSLLTQSSDIEVSQCITCFDSDGGLTVVGGNDAGDVGIYSLSTDEGTRFQFSAGLHKGHVAGVQSFLQWDDMTWLTGGEDSKICIWKRLEAQQNSSAIDRSRVVMQTRSRKRLAPY